MATTRRKYPLLPGETPEEYRRRQNREKMRRWRADPSNEEAEDRRRRARYAANAEAERAKKRAYHAANRDVQRRADRRHYEKHGDERRRRIREWCLANPEKVGLIYTRESV